MSTPITLPNQLYERVKQTAQNKQQSVDEYVSELIASVLDENDIVPITSDEALAREARAWDSLYPELREKYSGRYVAIHQGQVLDVDEDALSLNRRVQKHHPNKTIWVSRVEEDPFPKIFTRSLRLNR